MGIKKVPQSQLGAGFEHVLESRNFIYDNINGWKVTVTWEKQITTNDGNLVADAGTSMRLHFINSDYQTYRGTIWISKDGKIYDPHADDYNWRKSNKSRESALKFEDIKSLVDQVWAYYLSPEGQFQMYRQSRHSAEREIANLQAHIDDLKSWRSSMTRKEDELIRTSPEVIALLQAEQIARFEKPEGKG